MSSARRIATYVMAFAGLLMVLYAAAGLLALIVATLTLRQTTLIGIADIRSRTSVYLAALIVGLPLWLGFWSAVQRRVACSPDERDAPERRVFLAAVFAVTSVVGLFALHTLLRVLLTLPGAPLARPAPLDGIAAGTRLVVYGAAWFAYARITWRERSPRDDDAAHDLAVYVLAGFALSFLAIGLGQALRQLVSDLLAAGRPPLLTEPAASAWTIWGAIVAWIVAGGLIWAAIWRYDLAWGGPRLLRVLYLYIVLVAAVPATLAGGTQGLYELLRRLSGDRATGDDWGFLREMLPLLLVGGAIWAYHWAIMRRQAEPPRTAAPGASAGIPWPRRPAVALLALLGLGMAVPAVISLLWLGLDGLLNTGASLSGPGWWRERASLGLAASLVGGGAWLGAWSVLQRAAATAPTAEHGAPERRLFLGAITLTSALAALGFTVALLWLILRTVLGEALEASTLSRALKDLSTVVILAAMATYHGLLLRDDLGRGAPGRQRVRVVALVAPGAEEALTELRQRSGMRIEVAGHLTADQAGGQGDVATLQQLLASLRTREQGQRDRALLILRPEGGNLYLYTRVRSRQAPVQAPAIPVAGTPTDGTA